MLALSKRFSPLLPLLSRGQLFQTMPHQQQKVYDLQSDTATEPTDAMFDLMKSASRGDDVFAEDTTINELESYVAKLLGQEAALFCVSGCMTNQLGLRVLLTQPPHSVLCDSRSHVFNYECGGIAYHSQASVSPVIPKNGHHLTVQDVASNLITDTLCSPVTKVVSLENTLNGTIMPLEEIKRIRQFTKEKGLALHLDGARLWNASEASGIPLHEYGSQFDTISVCLSKGVGAPIGSMLAGSKENMQRARQLRKLMGGGWRQAGLLAAAAHHCIETIVPTMSQTHALAKQLATGFESLGMQITTPCETNMVYVDTARTGITVDDLYQALKQKNILIGPSPGTQARIVLHYQITQHVVDTMIQVTTELVEKRKLDPTPIVINQQQQQSVYPSSSN
ncbi:pyridoxal phosphate-dependent transferase [Helicostylum pulchrum]|nr:pyridoxal phosphate-dependent transferase [Helicostylum pulchrum]